MIENDAEMRGTVYVSRSVIPYVPGPAGASRVYRSAVAARPAWASRSASYWPVRVPENAGKHPAEPDENDANRAK
jgi:hypothetical protein